MFDVYASGADPMALRQLRFNGRSATLVETSWAPDAAQGELTVVPAQPLLLELVAYVGVRLVRLAPDGSVASTSGFVPGSSAALASQQRVYVVQPNASATANTIILAYQITSDGALQDLGVSYALPPGPMLQTIGTPFGVVPMTRYVQARSVHVSSDGERLWLAVHDCGGAPYAPLACSHRALSLLVDPATGQLGNPVYSGIPLLFGNYGNLSTLSLVPGSAFVGVVDSNYDLIETFSEAAGKLTYTYCGEPPYPDVKTLNSIQANPDGSTIYAVMDDGRVHKMALDPESRCPRVSETIALQTEKSHLTSAVLAGPYLFVAHGRSVYVMQALEGGFRVLVQTELGSVVTNLAVRPRP